MQVDYSQEPDSRGALGAAARTELLAEAALDCLDDTYDEEAVRRKCVRQQIEQDATNTQTGRADGSTDMRRPTGREKNASDQDGVMVPRPT